MNSFQKEKFPFFSQLFYIKFQTIFFFHLSSVFSVLFSGEKLHFLFKKMKISFSFIFMTQKLSFN